MEGQIRYGGDVIGSVIQGCFTSFRTTTVEVEAIAGLDLNFDGDGEAAAVAEGLAGDFKDGSGLLALVFAAFDEGEDAADEGEVDGRRRFPTQPRRNCG
jgi:hypothetical protein